MKVLALNAGATSHVAALYGVATPPPFEPPAPVWRAEVDGRETTFDELVANVPVRDVEAVGHRVVHPGLQRGYAAEARADDTVRAEVAEAAALATEHNRLALEGLDATTRRFGTTVPQVVVYDTALRDASPAFARTLPTPPQWNERYGLRRFGFHGISVHDACERVRRHLGGGAAEARILVAHLGSGVSVSAFRGARIVETTMGLTPLDGAMMAKRAGATDPGAILYLAQHERMPLEAIATGLNREAGLAGFSGVSYDSRDVLAAIARGDARARFAWDFYAYRLRWHVGALVAAALDGIDAFAFTGPVGEHMAELRASVCAGLQHLGIALDDTRNRSAHADAEISAPGAGVRTFVIRTLEEWAIAKRTTAFLAAAAAAG